MMAINIKAAQKCLQVLWIRPDFPPRQFQEFHSCTLLNSGTNFSLRKIWTFYFILQEWSRRTEQSLRLTASSAHLSTHWKLLWPQPSTAAGVGYAFYCTSLYRRKKMGVWDPLTQSPILPQNSDQWPGDGPVTSPSTDIAKWWPIWLLFLRSPLSKASHPTRCWNTYS